MTNISCHEEDNAVNIRRLHLPRWAAQLSVSAVLVFLGACPLLSDPLTLFYGEGAGLVRFLNETNHPDETSLPLPPGPLSFRMDGGTCWILDSIGGKVLQTTLEGKVGREISLFQEPGSHWVGDFALKKDSAGHVIEIWFLDRMSQEIVVCSTQGKRLRSFGGFGKNAGIELQDVYRLEIGKSGRVYVSDIGRKKILVLNPDGSLRADFPCTARGFFLDEDETLAFLDWNEDTQKVALQRRRLDGTTFPSVSLGLKCPFVPDLWFPQPSGEFLITFHERGTIEEKHKIARITPKGQVSIVLELSEAQGMVRFLAPRDGESVWVGLGDFSKAPIGGFRIEPFVLGGPPEG